MSELHGRVVRLFQELKRRGVLRVAAVYLVGAWVAIQVADVTFPRVGLSDGAVTFIIVFLAALFPVVVGLSWVFDLTRTGPVRVEEPVPAAETPRGGVRARVPMLLAVALAVPLVAFGLWFARGDARASSLDRQLVAVMPFRVAGASSELAYLREGLMDLLAARIGGSDGQLRVVPPRTMGRHLREALGSLDVDPDREAALEMAFDLKAGRMLQGEVIRSGHSVIVTATLYDVVDGRVIDSKQFPPYPTDSIHALVDAIATQLIAAESGLRSDRLAAVTTRSVPALRAFIDAEHAFRRGQHRRAVQSYDRAVQLDSTFAVAALGLLRARGWSLGVETSTTYDRTVEIVQRGIDRLGAADRLFFEVFDRGRHATERERLDDAMHAAEQHPEQADLQYLFGDRLVHFGNWIGVEDALDRARVQLERVVALDSTYAEPLIHLFELAVAREDTAGTRRYGELLLAIDSTSPYSTRVRYVRSLGLDGSTDAEPVRLDSLPIEHLDQLTHLGWSLPTNAAVRDEYMRRWRAASLPEEVTHTSRRIELLAMRGGQPSLIEEVARRVGQHEWSDADRVLRAIYWERDPEGGAEAMEGMRAQIGTLRSQSEPRARSTAAMLECLNGQYAVAVGDARGALASATALEDTVGLEEWALSEVATCRRYLRAGAAVDARRADALRQVSLFDDHLRSGPEIDPYISMPYLLGLVWMWEELGQPERALAASRRKLYVPYSQFWVNELNGERARLADQLGRNDEAIQAYREYLSYFHAPEGVFVARVDRARERLAVLAGEGRTNR